MDGMGNKMTKIFCLLTGAGFGVLMAAIVLFALIHTNYASGTAGFLIVAMITTVLPWTIETFYKEKTGAFVIELVSTIVSFLVVCAYILTVTSGNAFGTYYGEMRMNLFIKMGIYHFLSLVFTGLRMYLGNRRSS